MTRFDFHDWAAAARAALCTTRNHRPAIRTAKQIWAVFFLIRGCLAADNRFFFRRPPLFLRQHSFVCICRGVLSAAFRLSPRLPRGGIIDRESLISHLCFILNASSSPRLFAHTIPPPLEIRMTRMQANPFILYHSTPFTRIIQAYGISGCRNGRSQSVLFRTGICNSDSHSLSSSLFQTPSM